MHAPRTLPTYTATSDPTARQRTVGDASTYLAGQPVQVAIGGGHQPSERAVVVEDLGAGRYLLAPANPAGLGVQTTRYGAVAAGTDAPPGVHVITDPVPAPAGTPTRAPTRGVNPEADRALDARIHATARLGTALDTLGRVHDAMVAANQARLVDPDDQDDVPLDSALSSITVTRLPGQAAAALAQFHQASHTLADALRRC